MPSERPPAESLTLGRGPGVNNLGVSTVDIVMHGGAAVDWGRVAGMPPEVADGDDDGDDGDRPAVEGAIGFAAWLEVQAGRLRAKGGPWAVWLAGRVAELADDARSLRAGTPEDLEARSEVLERDLAE